MCHSVIYLYSVYLPIHSHLAISCLSSNWYISYLLFTFYLPTHHFNSECLLYVLRNTLFCCLNNFRLGQWGFFGLFIHGPTASSLCFLLAGGGRLGCISFFSSIMGYPRFTLGMSHPILAPHISCWKMVFEPRFEYQMYSWLLGNSWF